MQADVRGIVKNGQLDLVSGGWSAPDEAITTYDDILDNFMIGQRFLSVNSALFQESVGKWMHLEQAQDMLG